MKVLVCDYDDTFYLNNQDIEINKEMVKKFRKEGNIFVFATGRSYYDFMLKKDKYNLEYDYLILNHGTTIIKGDIQISNNKYIDNDIVLKIKNDLHLENSISNFCCTFENSRASFTDNNIIKIYVKYDSFIDIKSIKSDIINKYNDYVNCIMLSNHSIEIVNKDVSKVNAIIFLINKLKIDSKDVYTIGDGYSDIDMINRFNGFCMENSIDILKNSNIKKYKSVSKLIGDILNDKV